MRGAACAIFGSGIVESVAPTRSMVACAVAEAWIAPSARDTKIGAWEEALRGKVLVAGCRPRVATVYGVRDAVHGSCRRRRRGRQPARRGSAPRERHCWWRSDSRTIGGFAVNVRVPCPQVIFPLSVAGRDGRDLRHQREIARVAWRSSSWNSGDLRHRRSAAYRPCLDLVHAISERSVRAASGWTMNLDASGHGAQQAQPQRPGRALQEAAPVHVIPPCRVFGGEVSTGSTGRVDTRLAIIRVRGRRRLRI